MTHEKKVVELGLEALSILENLDCHGHNSLNFGQILKILVPKHIYFPRPFFLAPTGALEEGNLCVRPCVRPSVCDIIQNKCENEF